MKSIEEKLWDYIDGNCTVAEQKAISLLIEQDEIYRVKYHELLGFNKELNSMELEEPAMAFTYNVMEQIRAENAKTPLKAAINHNMMKGIAAFFLITIAVLLVVGFSQINWSAGNVTVSPMFKIPAINNLFTPALLKSFAFFDVVLALFFFDSLLRKRKLSKQI